MAEPLSFVASVIAVATLAGNVVSKGYRYLKAAKDCSKDVRNLIVEVNILCGILDRLVILLQGRNSGSSATRVAACSVGSTREENIKDDTVIDGTSDSEDESLDTEDEANVPSETLETPNFIHECQRTLEKIQGILNKFGGPTAGAKDTSPKTSRLTLSSLRRLDAKDLKWPLSKSKTLKLIQTLERHKTTCTIALAEGGLVGIHKVLMEAESSNRRLADIQAKQKEMLELQLTEAEAPERVLTLLSPVSPTIKHQAFKRERQAGTGMWLFDLPEMKHWLDHPSDALWIYGIPGAGKTTLSTLVVDTVLNPKRSNTVGVAYFYIRHDDQGSHNPANVLGSILCQLARQKTEALAHIMKRHKQVASQDTSTLDEQELIKTLHEILQWFTETYIMIDGLDECGAIFDLNRKRLIEVLAGLHHQEETSIRILIFSRDEQDIRKRLTEMQYRNVSIAAESADLRLFVNAWLGSLDIQSETLRVEVVDTLIAEAQGMYVLIPSFMWVRAQVDYLQRLPNDAEKRKALKKLPPDLPQTYIRIFETMNGIYPPQTTVYIQRILKWLVHFASEERATFESLGRTVELPSLDELCQAISIESTECWPTKDFTPNPEHVLRWLGCLVRFDLAGRILQLSHYTIKEFLSMDPQAVSSSIACQYLVDSKDNTYLHNTFLKTLLNSHFKGIKCTTEREVGLFLSEHDFYRFFSMPPSSAFKLWETCRWWSEDWGKESVEILERPNGWFRSPLHVAVMLGLKSELERLLGEGVDPDVKETLKGFHITPLHLAICSYQGLEVWISPSHLSMLGSLEDGVFTICHVRGEILSLQMTEILVNAGADIDQQLNVHISEYHGGGGEESWKFTVTPLILALLCHNWKVATLLRNAGAKQDATAYNCLEGFPDLCSVQTLLGLFPNYRNTGSDFFECSSVTIPDPQSAFIKAFSHNSWDEVEELLAKQSDLDVDVPNEKGRSAIHLAAEWPKSDALQLLLTHGANPNLNTPNRNTAISIASAHGHVEHIKLLLESGADLEHRNLKGWTPLLRSVHDQKSDALQFLIDAGADVKAVLNNGRDAMHIAVRGKDTISIKILMASKVDYLRPDNYGTMPLHLACYYGHKHLVKRILALTTIPSHDVNVSSLKYGTPLYCAAGAGFASIIKCLLDHGAEIDQNGPGNLLGSALMVACSSGHCAAVRVLLFSGAALEVEGARFKSAEGTARAFRQEKILEILAEHERTCLQEGKCRCRDEVHAETNGNAADAIDLGD
ncbi:MAG: hypothetical protein Q9170_003365 [Blastenia crenularia]